MNTMAEYGCHAVLETLLELNGEEERSVHVKPVEND